jgi:hypothetical protein
MAEQKDLEKRHQGDQQEIKGLQQELRRKDKALAERKLPGARGFACYRFSEFCRSC